MLSDIIGGIIVPHLIAPLLLLRIAMLEVRPDKSATGRENMARLFSWVPAHYPAMVMHPLYWVATGIVTAYLLVEPLRRLFTWQ